MHYDTHTHWSLLVSIKTTTATYVHPSLSIVFLFSLSKVAIYCEGTRFTKEKHKKSMEYAKKKGLPLLKHHLAPRTKGFALLAEYLRGGNFKAVYDVGVAYPNWPHDSAPTHLDIMLGKRVDIFWYMR